LAPADTVKGTFDVTVTVSDNGSPILSDSKTFHVVVSPPNHAPTLDAIADQSMRKGNVLTLTAHATDPDVGQSLTFSISAAASLNASIDGASGVVAIAPAVTVSGTFDVTVSVKDNGSPVLSDSKTFHVVVTPPNHAPTLSAIPDQ